MTDYARLFVSPHRVSYRDGELEFGESYELQAMNMADPRNQQGLAFTREALQAADALVRGWGGTLVVVLTPTREQVYRHLTEPVMGADQLAIYDGAYNAMLGLCDELDLVCFDPLPQLQQHAQWGEHLYYSDDMHLNPHGNDVFAKLTWGWLGGAGLLYAPAADGDSAGE